MAPVGWGVVYGPHEPPVGTHHRGRSSHRRSHGVCTSGAAGSRSPPGHDDAWRPTDEQVDPIIHWPPMPGSTYRYKYLQRRRVGPGQMAALQAAAIRWCWRPRCATRSAPAPTTAGCRLPHHEPGGGEPAPPRHRSPRSLLPALSRLRDAAGGVAAALDDLFGKEGALHRLLNYYAWQVRGVAERPAAWLRSPACSRTNIVNRDAELSCRCAVRMARGCLPQPAGPVLTGLPARPKARPIARRLRRPAHPANGVARRELPRGREAERAGRRQGCTSANSPSPGCWPTRSSPARSRPRTMAQFGTTWAAERDDHPEDEHAIDQLVPPGEHRLRLHRPGGRPTPTR